MTLRVGVQIQPQHADFDAMRRAWTEADELGVDTIFTWDHFYPLYGDADGKHYEALVTLGAMASVTERAQIGALVICNSYRNPEYLADAHRTLDHASGGRAILGIGAGWFQRDYDEYGYEFGDAPARLRALRAALPRIRDRISKLNPPPIGRDPGEIERTWGVNAGKLDAADGLVEAGVTHLIMGIGGDGKGYDLGPVRELVQYRDAAAASA